MEVSRVQIAEGFLEFCLAQVGGQDHHRIELSVRPAALYAGLFYPYRIKALRARLEPKTKYDK